MILPMVAIPVKLLAYLDPGSGSFLLQLLLATLLGAGFAIKIYWKKIKGWFKKEPKEITLKNDDEGNVGGE